MEGYRFDVLDQWMADRFRRYYTTEVEKRILEWIGDGFEKRGMPHQKDFFFKGTYQRFTRQHQIEEGSQFFTKQYESLEDLASVPADPDLLCIAGPMRQMEQFLERVSSRMNSVGQISRTEMYKETEQIFLEVFGSPEGFANFLIQYSEAARHVYTIMCEEGALLEIEREFRTTLLDIRREQMPYLMSQLFQDLEQQKTKENKTNTYLD